MNEQDVGPVLPDGTLAWTAEEAADIDARIAAMEAEEQVPPQEAQAALEEEEAVKIQKKRVSRPMPKLTLEMLVGPNGIKELVDRGKTLGITGAKGKEKNEMKTVLAMYALWAHSRVPRLAFHDVVRQAQKLGGMCQVQAHMDVFRYPGRGDEESYLEEFGEEEEVDWDAALEAAQVIEEEEEVVVAPSARVVREVDEALLQVADAPIDEDEIRGLEELKNLAERRTSRSKRAMDDFDLGLVISGGEEEEEEAPPKRHKLVKKRVEVEEEPAAMVEEEEVHVHRKRTILEDSDSE